MLRTSLLGWLWILQTNQWRQQDLDLLWHSWIRRSWNNSQQRSWPSRWLLVAWRPHVRASHRNVSTNAHAHGKIIIWISISSPPFTASDPMKIYNIILRGIEQLDFPRHVSKTAIAIIKKFCKENPTERLGYQKDGILDIRFVISWLITDLNNFNYIVLFSKHRWYSGFDWEGLEARTLTPPILPKVIESFYLL